ncbi:HNH endonuclease [Chitinophaga ginsengisegetis]|uniref:HNH endonuclease n=1 Tax=Chitinophaga ginsengisegetis TaxID=393003 RepID=UPI00344256FB
MLCEVCGFDFYDSYGDIGKGFIECHHKTPLSKITASTKTSLKDLALVCSNCHRMLHKDINVLSIEGLRERMTRV